MRLRIVVILLSTLALSWVAQDAQAGAIRYTGKKIGKGSVIVAHTTADAAQTTVGGAATVGKATGGVIKTGAIAVGKGAAAAPGMAVRGTKAVAKGIAKAIW